MRRIGVGYRKPLANWINTHPDQINCLEITADHFFDQPSPLVELRRHYDLLLHGLGLSLGTPGELDKHYLQRLAALCQIANPLWVSDHLAFTKTQDVDLGHLNPIPYTTNCLEYFIDHVLEAKDACQKPFLIENITYHLEIDSPLQETDFINRVCERANCYLLLDVTNLLINSRNHDFQARHWLREINPDYIKQLHIVGYSQRDGVFYDSHDNNIQRELYELTRQVIEYSKVDTVIIERDNNFPTLSQLTAELSSLEACFEVH